MTSNDILWSGGYTGDDGAGLGIVPLRVSAGGAVTPAAGPTELSSPTFLALHPTLPVLYTANESAETVSAFTMESLTPSPLGASRPAGSAVCHVNVSPGGDYLVAACWGDGRVLVYPLTASGEIVEGVVADAAADPHPDERTPLDHYTQLPPQSRAHASLFLGPDRFVTTDLGFDLLRFWRFADGVLELEQEVELGVQSGPRHLAAVDDDHFLVVTEYSVEIVEIARDAAGWHVVSTTPVLADGAQPGDTASEISVEGDRVYVSVRGSNLAAVLERAESGLTPLAAVPSGGVTPRHHLVRDGVLHIAHQGSDEVTTHALDASTGIPTGIVDRLSLGAPSVLVSARG